MAEFSTIARPYAEATFHAALDQKNDLLAWSKALNALAQIVRVDDVREVLADPLLDTAKRGSLLDDLLSKETQTNVLPAGVKNLVNLLIENKRWEVLPQIAEQFEHLRNQHEGKAVAQITSAYELEKAQLDELLAGLQKKFGVELKPQVKVDPSLIGGVRVVVGDQVLDTSVQAQLTRLRDTLVAE